MHKNKIETGQRTKDSTPFKANKSKDGLPYLLRHNQREHRFDHDLLWPHVPLPLLSALEYPEDPGGRSPELSSV